MKRRGANFIIEGDNVDVLKTLSRTHKGRVKCILIDPPYNTMESGWVYNDRRPVSQWLEGLYWRLKLARPMLSEDGVILVCIDDDHRAVVDLLMEQVFPRMRVGSFVWRTRTGANDAKGRKYSTDHEHILVYANPGFRFGGKKKGFDNYSNPDNDLRGEWIKDNLTAGKDLNERPKTFYPIQDPRTGAWYPCNPVRVWGFASEKIEKNLSRLQSPPMEELVRQGKVLFPDEDEFAIWETKEELLSAIRASNVPVTPKQKIPLLWEEMPDLDFWVGKKVGFGRPAYKRHRSEVKSDTQPVSSWVHEKGEFQKMVEGFNNFVENFPIAIETGMTKDGTEVVRAIFKRKQFDFPKPPELITHLVKQCTDEDSIVVDFFAGSGTTAHAVLLANREDDGVRSFILVSNTEATQSEPGKNVCRDTCRARVKAVMRGYGSGKSAVPGLGDGFAYLHADPVPPRDASRKLSDADAWTLLQLVHGCEVRPFEPDLALNTASAGGITVAMLHTVDEGAVSALQGIVGDVVAYSRFPSEVADKAGRDGLESRDTFAALRGALA